jgi:hypothetical protein
MTEAEWLKCGDPTAMLTLLGQRFSDRKLRLFSCACCRRVWRFARDERLAGVLDAIERYADGEAKERDRMDARKIAEAVYANVDKPQDCLSIELRTAAEKSIRKHSLNRGELAAAAVGWSGNANFTRIKATERRKQAVLLRDMAGDPFHPIALDPAWRTSDVVLLAKGIYEDRAFDRMPILSDALQDAGCDKNDLLTHLRDTKQVHVRGCWVVDLVLGKS